MNDVIIPVLGEAGPWILLVGLAWGYQWYSTRAERLNTVRIDRRRKW